jgi:hypothetical protein
LLAKIPNPKPQVNPNRKNPKEQQERRIGASLFDYFGIGICLGFGAWDLGFLR